MADLNEVRLIGRLTRDVELRSTSTGQSIAQFGLATGRKYQGNDGTLKEETTFIDITAWGKTAENVSKYCKKGSLVFVGGRLKLDTWQDKTTGANRSKLSVVAENIQFLSKQETTEIQQYTQGNPLPGQYQSLALLPQKQDAQFVPSFEPVLDEPPF